MGLSISLSSMLRGVAWLAGSASAAHISSPRAASSDCKLPANNNVYLSSGFGYELNCAPSTGSLNAFMIFVDFPDQGATDTPQDLYSVFLPGAAEWYASSSYGKLSLNVSADTSRFYRMPATAASYGWQRGLTSEAHQKYIQDALDAYIRVAGQQALPTVDVLYVVPTANATAISFSPTYMGDVATRSGRAVAKKCVTFGHDAYATWHYKVLNHETGHTMCLPDMYPLPSGPTGLYIGGWDMMGYINGPSPDYFAWNKWRLGWLSDEQIDCVTAAGSTTHTLSPLETTGGIKAVVVKHNSTAALVAEVRSAHGVDSATCAAGVLLYSVSTVTETGLGPIRVLDANPGSGGCAGDELNDAPLSLDRTRSYTVPGWNVTVSLTSKSGDDYVVNIRV